MNKLILTCSLLCSVIALTAKAQDCTTCKGSNNLSLTTGLNTSGTLMPMPSTATGGVVDPYWQLVNVAPPSANGSGGIAIPNAYTVQFGTSVGIPTWLNQPGADALSVIPNHQFSTNNSVASQPWRFLRKFYLCKDTSVRFVVSHMGDDVDTVKIFDSTGALLHTDTGVGWGSVHNFDKTLDMHAGCCYMTVELANTGASLMGFSVKADLSVTNSSLANPNEVCCATSTVSGQKVLDANCNGKFDAGDLPGVGWTFNLLSGSSVIQTGTTDANGEFTFYNIKNGTYTLQEVAQAGYSPGNPASGQQTVVVSKANSVQTFQFFNCKEGPTPSATPSPTASPPPTPPPGCAQVTGEARCVPGGGYSYTFSATNSTGGDMSQILVSPVTGGTFTVSPQLFNLSPPLKNGQSTTQSATIGNVKPGEKACFFVTLMSDKAACCTVQVCPTLPVCGAR